MIEKIALAGGLFALLAFWHFVADWVFQTHNQAMKKSDHWGARLIHCLLYTAFFVPVFGLLNYHLLDAVIAAAVLLVSHYICDSYWPVYAWARWVRRIPEIKSAADMRLSATRKPLHLVLFIVVDQIFHLSFLWVLVYLAVKRWEWTYYSFF